MRQIANLPPELRAAIMNAGGRGPPHIPTNLPYEEQEAIARRHGYMLTPTGNLIPLSEVEEAPKEPTIAEARSSWQARYGCVCSDCAAAFLAGGVVAADAALAFEGEVGSIVPILAGTGDRYGTTAAAADSEALAIEVVRRSHLRRAAIRQLFDVSPEVKPGIGAKGARTGERG